MFRITGSVLVLRTRLEATKMFVCSLINLFFVCLQYLRSSKDAKVGVFCVWIYGRILWITVSYYCIRVIIMSTGHQVWLWYTSLVYQLYVLKASMDGTVTEENRTNWDADNPLPVTSTALALSYLEGDFTQFFKILLRDFIMNRCWILSNNFSASEIIM